MPTDLGGEVAELLQQLIRNACVNDGSVDVRPRGPQRRDASRPCSRAMGSICSPTSPSRAPIARGPDRRQVGRVRPRSLSSGTPTSSRPIPRNGATTRSAGS